MNRFIFELSRFIAINTARVLWRLRVRGLEHIPPTGGCILACSHQSYLDPPLVGAACPRPLRYLARRSLFENEQGELTRGGRLLSYYGGVPLSREGTALEALRTGVQEARNGGAVLMFPEGTRSPDGDVREFKPGVGMLALRSGVPVVPVSLTGLTEVWPRGRSRPRLFTGRARMVFGEPVTYSKPMRADDVAADIRERVLALREQPGPRRTAGAADDELAAEDPLGANDTTNNE